MGIYINSEGKPIVNASGAPIDCSTCPCDTGSEGTIDCCFDDLLPECLKVTLTTVTDKGITVDCDETMNQSYEMTWLSGCIWRLDDGPCPAVVGGNIRAQITITTLSPTECQVAFGLNCLTFGTPLLAGWSATFSPSATLPFTLNLGGNGSCNWPATVLVEAC